MIMILEWLCLIILRMNLGEMSDESCMNVGGFGQLPGQTQWLEMTWVTFPRPKPKATNTARSIPDLGASWTSHWGIPTGSHWASSKRKLIKLTVRTPPIYTNFRYFRGQHGTTNFFVTSVLTEIPERGFHWWAIDGHWAGTAGSPVLAATAEASKEEVPHDFRTFQAPTKRVGKGSAGGPKIQ